MKKQLFSSLVALLFTALHLYAQNYITQVKPIGSKTWGYANLKGEIILKADYVKCWKFSEEGLALIYDVKEKQFYFINLKGERLKTEIEGYRMKEGFGLNFNTEGFVDGMALVKYLNKWGYLNAAGKLAIKAQYDDASYFNKGFATAKRGDKFFVLNKAGDEILLPGNVIDINEFAEGLAPFRAADKQFGFVGVDGKIAIPARFESVGYFSNGLAWAKASGGLLGYINTKGQWVIKPQFTAGKDFDKESGIARVKVEDKWAFISSDGSFKKLYDGEVLNDFSEGLAEGKKNEKIGFYDNTGKWVIEPQFDGSRDFKNGYAAAKKGDKWGIIDKQGKWIIEPTYEGIKDMELVK
ncbi:MAG: WG repeat-containing protein [Bacteroidetes bacterium]|nr:WG repeat-containing protein [Bacteroidota bacterium]